ncbi:unnamed protein product, partial [Mesorhabditis spiculigera]
MSSSIKALAKPKQSFEEALHRGPDQRDITTMDILEERIRRTEQVREITIGGQKQKWNYRSEMVNKHGLDNDHRYIWMVYAGIIVFGFGAFVWVKSNVVKNRQIEMQEREKIRRSMNLIGEDRKKIGVIEE